VMNKNFLGGELRPKYKKEYKAVMAEVRMHARAHDVPSHTAGTTLPRRSHDMNGVVRCYLL
jgi:hypothetical protein